MTAGNPWTRGAVPPSPTGANSSVKALLVEGNAPFGAKHGIPDLLQQLHGLFLLPLQRVDVLQRLDGLGCHGPLIRVFLELNMAVQIQDMPATVITL